MAKLFCLSVKFDQISFDSFVFYTRFATYSFDYDTIDFSKFLNQTCDKSTINCSKRPNFFVYWSNMFKLVLK